MNSPLFIRKNFAVGVFWPVVSLLILMILCVGLFSGLIIFVLYDNFSDLIKESMDSKEKWIIYNYFRVFFIENLMPVLFFQGIIAWVASYFSKSGKKYKVILSWKSGLIMFVLLVLSGYATGWVMRFIPDSVFSAESYASDMDRSLDTIRTIRIMLSAFLVQFLLLILAFWMLSLSKFLGAIFPYGLQKRESEQES